ncbi:bifunctional UDP-N-acetylglucosamine diphosphorylase/glucosamine-1-phosphate N-acetyltransferase GlmU [Paraeggerthella hongkongensis]|uniref:bifunctional UDP-N-acetylglucosamine diphosphorylase/glucosamine-1-phosphate N-acetyltransferase GlmU n=1 Tax=Paraeggerthella hominis TaxID=2897351 RepID=UPI001C127EF7|nr:MULTISPECIES: bifunctional UDP-N-acetylglucosamine diphosphorylase/glucosamine-1-phosphate N-acetyltransferase GlmU [Paraeggerthella]MBU5405745.1 bifunctional UDP-N-acetylglucosamine diphosphorylase/glucosamine-1-phosphate N-acetyltransferase GlmU [Paraeggerthella hongkongensis]MCD2433592.1 bifunctional UDP-N-acetylglucosamine diphosphorylase/glucosamine-1-phosphate N-acetyltransferase GlmU [Paraeggerthella hominis]
MEAAAIVLAAGAGTRMKSKKPKVAHEVLGKPLVRWVVDAAREAGVDRVVSVVGHAREQVIPLIEGDTQAVVQSEQNGTAGAVLVCADALADFDGSLVVLSGDCPLITSRTIAQLVEARERDNAAVVVLTMELDDPFGYGRIVRDERGSVARIVEQKDATPEEAALRECNSGFYCFDARALFDALAQVGNDNAQGEFYLTDVLEICRRAGRPVLALPCDDASECLGVNSRAQLAEATKLLQRRINAGHMANGVTMTDPDQVWIGPDVVIEQDVELLPQTFLMGSTRIGEDSVVGPNSRLTDTVVGCGCTVDETVAVEARLDDGATAGPRAYLRPAAHLCEGAKAGTHVEIKKSTVGKGSKVPHLSYIGDTTIGEDVNIGAGSITCNYDGKKKWPTVIGDGAFVGSDTMMVAPVTIGAGAIIGAGSCIAKDVAADALALTRPEQREIPGWAAKKRARQAEA